MSFEPKTVNFVNETMLGKFEEKLDEDISEENMAGWIAIYNGKKLEIKKSEAEGIYGAKQLAIKKLKVPKSKHCLLAIDVAYD